jgi:hypothetical protein
MHPHMPNRSQRLNGRKTCPRISLRPGRANDGSANCLFIRWFTRPLICSGTSWGHGGTLIVVSFVCRSTHAVYASLPAERRVFKIFLHKLVAPRRIRTLSLSRRVASSPLPEPDPERSEQGRAGVRGKGGAQRWDHTRGARGGGRAERCERLGGRVPLPGSNHMLVRIFEVVPT